MTEGSHLYGQLFTIQLTVPLVINDDLPYSNQQPQLVWMIEEPQDLAHLLEVLEQKYFLF